MFVYFLGRKVPVKRVQRKFIYFAGRKAVGRSHSGLCNRKKRNKQTFLNIKNGETISFYKKFFLEIKTAS